MISGATWIGGLDVQSYTQGLMLKEEKNLTKASNLKMNQLNQMETNLKNQLGVYTQLQSLLNAFATNITALSTAFNANYTVNSSDPTIVNASTSGTNVAAGTHQIVVQSLAQTESYNSQNFAVANQNTGLGITDSLTVSVGSSNFNINVASGDSIQNIVDHINSAAQNNNVGVTASYVATSAGNYKIVLQSTQSGTANKATITGGSNLGFTEWTAATDASFTFDNLSFTGISSNTNIMVEGLNLSLGKVSAGSPPSTPSTLTVTATNPVTNASKAIQDVVNSYNQINQLIQQTLATVGTAVITPAGTTAVNNNTPDATLNLISSSLQNALSAAFSGTNAFKTLADVGIAPDPHPSPISITFPNGTSGSIIPTGQLKVDTTALNNALTSNFTGVQTLLSSQNGIMTQANTNLLAKGTGTIDKILNDTTFGVNHQVTTQLSGIDQQITDEQNRVSMQTNQLIYKYGQLTLVLEGMQTTSLYMSQQIQLMSQHG